VEVSKQWIPQHVACLGWSVNSLTYLPFTKPGVMCLYSCSYTDIDCPVVEVSCFWSTQQSRCVPSSPFIGQHMSQKIHCRPCGLMNVYEN
jgi:hypothetical protein